MSSLQQHKRNNQIGYKVESKQLNRILNIFPIDCWLLLLKTATHIQAKFQQHNHVHFSWITFDRKSKTSLRILLSFLYIRWYHTERRQTNSSKWKVVYEPGNMHAAWLKCRSQYQICRRYRQIVQSSWFRYRWIALVELYHSDPFSASKQRYLRRYEGKFADRADKKRGCVAINCWMSNLHDFWYH